MRSPARSCLQRRSCRVRRLLPCTETCGCSPALHRLGRWRPLRVAGGQPHVRCRVLQCPPHPLQRRSRLSTAVCCRCPAPPSTAASSSIVNGKISAVGASVVVPPGARVIDAAGKVVTPGWLDSATQIGVVEIPSVG